MEIKAVVIDVNAYTAFKLGKPGAIEIIKRIPLIVINPVILGELLCGFVIGTKEAQNKEELGLFLKSKRVRIVGIDRNTSICYSQLYKELKEKGKPIPTNDLWIAATAIQHKCGLFTYDKHFEYISNLKIIANLGDLG